MCVVTLSRRFYYRSGLLLVHTFNSLDLTIFVVFQLANFQAAQPCATARRYAVVVEEVPFALELGDTVVCCPADNRSKNYALISEWPVRIVARSIAEVVSVACRI